MVITKHAEKRIKERNGLPKKSQERIIERVLSEGIKHNQTKGNLKRWIDYIYLQERKANNIRIYGDKAYLFCNETLITILQIPHNLMKEVNKIK